jgi:hypothetical protein
MEMEDVKLPVRVQLPNGVPLFLINEGVRDVVRLDLLFAGGYASIAMNRMEHRRLAVLDGYIALLRYIKGQINCYAMPIGDILAAAEKLGATVYLPPLKLCGDNAAMIGAQGYYEFMAGHTAGSDLNAYATMDISADFPE